MTEELAAAADRSSEPLFLDTETTGLDPWRDTKIRGISIAIGERSWYLPLTHPNSENLDRAEILRFFDRLKGRRFVGHNVKFDDSMLRADLGVALDWEWDTAIGAWLEDECLPAGLKERCSFLFGEDARAEQQAMKRLCAGPTLKQLEDEHYLGPEGAVSPGERRRQPMGITRAEARRRALEDPRYGRREMWDLTATEMAPYARRDAELTRDLWRYQQSLDHKHPLGVAMAREMRVSEILREQERIGIRIDAGRAETEYARATARLQELENLFDGVNLSSTPQLRELVYEKWGFSTTVKTDKGADSTSRAALELLGDDPRITSLLECRRLQKAISAYYRPLLEALDANDRIHPSIKQHGTRTGRFSCTRPNLYTVPRENTLAEVRSVFAADDGYELWEFDLAQAEVRVAAAISGEEAMLAAFREGRDLYQETADHMHCPRQTAKTITLAYNYGAGAEQLAASLLKGTGRAVTTRDIQQALALRFRFERLYPRLTAAKQRLSQIARDDGRLPLPPPGRFRHFRGAGHPPEPYKDALNTACQGGVAELQKQTLIEAAPRLSELGVRLLLNIYDSYLCEVPVGLAEQTRALLQGVTDDVNYWPSVRMLVEAKQWHHSPSGIASPVSAGSRSVSTRRGPAPSGSVKPTSPAGTSSSDTGPGSPGSGMSAPSPEQHSEPTASSPMSSSEASPARTSPKPDDGRGSPGNAAVSSSSSSDSPRSADPDGSSSRTFPVFSPPTKGKTSARSSARWRSAGIWGPGGCSTRSTSEWPSDAVVCSLSDIVETDGVSPKYFLSPRAASGILRRAQRRGKKLPAQLQQVLEATASTVEETSLDRSVPTARAD